ncbi:MAG: hypothetical protein WC511_01545 [Candidatus Pacearchaeota archaeon]
MIPRDDVFSLDEKNPFVIDDKKIGESLDKAVKEKEIDPKTQAIIDAFLADLGRLNDPNVTYNEKLDLIIDLKTRIVPIVFAELFQEKPNADISLIASRASFALKEAASIIIKKRETEVTDDINPYSPKFQKAFFMFIELFHKVMMENGADEIMINNVFGSLSRVLLGWEEQVVKSLKSVSSKALEKIENPFIAKFKDSLKEPTK